MTILGFWAPLFFVGAFLVFLAVFLYRAALQAGAKAVLWMCLILVAFLGVHVATSIADAQCLIAMRTCT